MASITASSKAGLRPFIILAPCTVPSVSTVELANNLPLGRVSPGTAFGHLCLLVIAFKMAYRLRKQRGTAPGNATRIYFLMN